MIEGPARADVSKDEGQVELLKVRLVVEHGCDRCAVASIALEDFGKVRFGHAAISLEDGKDFAWERRAVEIGEQDGKFPVQRIIT